METKSCSAVIIVAVLTTGCAVSPTSPTDRAATASPVKSAVEAASVVQITSATYARHRLALHGLGFEGPVTVIINGTDVSSRIESQDSTSITLKGNRKKLNLRYGPNQIQVIAGGIASNTFVLNL